MKKPNKIVLIIIDALRYDASRILLPLFNIIFTQHYTSNNWTLPVVARLLTGKLDTGLNVYSKMWTVPIHEKFKNGLSKPTIGKYLKDCNFTTHAKSEGIYVSKNFGFGKSSEWDSWKDENTGNGSKIIKPTFDKKKSKREFVLAYDYLVHDYLKDIMPDYKKRKTVKKLGNKYGIEFFYCKDFADIEFWEAAYWKRAAYLYNYLEWVKDSEALVILTADHGEGFYEYYGDYTHAGSHMSEEVAHVPLMIHWPGLKDRKRVSQFTRDIDVPATILDFAGSKVKLDGISLIPLIERKKIYKSVLTDNYVHRSGELWKYFFTPTEKKLSFVKKL